MTGLPNLAARLEYIESRVWTAVDKANYLATIPDPDATLEESLDPHLVAILKRVPMLQDYQLFAAPLSGETPATRRYGGMTLGQPPTLRLRTTIAGRTVTLTASLIDPTDGVGNLARPLAVDWGDGRVSHYELTAGQASLTATHEYTSASRYAIYAVVANNSGLRGAACAVVEVTSTTHIASGHQLQTQTALSIVGRAGLTGLSILNLPFTKDLRLALYFTAASGSKFRAGRSRIVTGPTNITVPVTMGDAYAHNPSRLEVVKLSIEPRHGISAPAGGRIPSQTLSKLLLGVFSTAQMRIADAALTLRVEMLAIYVQGSATPIASTALTVNTDGSISVPLVYRATSTDTWQRVERIEIAITPEMFEGFVLDVTPTVLPVGTTAAWAEQRPNVFTLVPDVPPQTQTNVFLPLVQK